MPNRLYSFRVNTESDAEMVRWLESRKNLSAWVKKAINFFMSRKSYVYTIKLTFWGTIEGERICTHTTTEWWALWFYPVMPQMRFHISAPQRRISAAYSVRSTDLLRYS